MHHTHPRAARMPPRPDSESSAFQAGFRSIPLANRTRNPFAGRCVGPATYLVDVLTAV